MEPPRRSGLAVAALVLGIIGLVLFIVFIPALLALIFGLVAASSIKKRPVRERLGMARAGWIMGGIGLIGGVVTWVVVAVFVSESTPWHDLEVGDCVDTDFRPGDSEIDQQRFPTRGCSDEHDAEVVAVERLNRDRDRPYPSLLELSREAFDVCHSGLQSYTGEDPDTGPYTVFPVYPDHGAWRATEGRVVCFAFDADGGTLTGTIGR